MMLYQFTFTCCTGCFTPSCRSTYLAGVQWYW